MQEEYPSASIIEKFVQGKQPQQEYCEDMVYVGSHFLAVVDGSTTVAEPQWRSPTSGRLAAELILQQIDSFPRDICARDAADLLTQTIQRDETFGSADTPAAALCIVSFHRREAWQIGDVTFWEPENGTPVRRSNPMDAHVAALRAAYLRHIIMTTRISEELLAENDPGRDCVLPFLRAGRTHRNALTLEGFGSITNTPVPDEYLIVTPIAGKASEAEIILHTDGYPKTCRTLLEAEDALQVLLREDPLCIGANQGTKGVKPGNHSYDDRAYLRAVI